MSTQTSEQQQSRLKDLIAKGKEQGYITYAEAKMKEDLTVMQKSRRELAAEVGSLALTT